LATCYASHTKLLTGSELAHLHRFATREQAQREITEYIEIFYNRIRKQARLGYLSPAAFNKQYYANQMAA
jgi:putative transposase